MDPVRLSPLKAPFPWFGGKSRVASIVWQRFGNVRNYVEPFFGSGAVLLGRPTPFDGVETVNDLDGFVANFWRAVQHEPDSVAKHADNPVNENDLHARHFWLVQQTETLRARLEGNPDFYDAKIAGWWVWGLCCWIGSGFCSGNGPWSVVDGKLVHLGNSGRGVNRESASIVEWFRDLQERMASVRVCSGDWSRVTGDSVTWNHPSVRAKDRFCGVFLDPPYSSDRSAVYREESFSVANDVSEWAIEAGKNPKMRIALCGYDGEHVMPDDWEVVAWKANGGYGNNGNEYRERIWFSPACLKPQGQMKLVGDG